MKKLPVVPEDLEESEDVIVVQDSKEGWAKAYRKLISLLYTGDIPRWDMSKIRPAGSRLKTFGGRASGPEPLESLFKYTVERFKEAAGRKLNSFECHSIMCKIGEVVVVCGVRRSAMISLSNLQDDRMRHAKSGQWWEAHPEMALANNSVAYTEKPEMESFLREWVSLVESKSGERGIFSRTAADKHVENMGRRETGHEWGTNPCSEIILRPYQFCNLTEVVVRPTDTKKSLQRKVKLATILGTIQSMFTHMPYLRPVWRKNTEEERLLGVSLTGIMDNEITRTADPSTLESLRSLAVQTNRDYSELLAIPPSAAITCVKPSGTVSQLVDSASGIHARHSDYYIRNVRGDNKDPLTQFMKDQGIPAEPDYMKPDSTTVFSFPVKAPDGATTRNQMTALEQLELWKRYSLHWCEHKPSVTISVRDEEWLQVGSWVFDNFDLLSGISFLPHSDHTYRQAPYEEIEKEQYLEALSKMPTSVDWAKLQEFEQEDNTAGSQTMACSSGACEIVDLT